MDSPGSYSQRARRESGEMATERTVRDDIRTQLTIGIAAVLLLVGGLGGWAATSNLAGAVLAAGTVVVDSNVKKVQHLTGGVVGEIRVRDGDRVAAGDLVMRLDEIVARANLGIIVSQLSELAVRQARLKAERDGAASVEIPRTLTDRDAEPDIAEIIAGERALFASRNTARAGQKAQLGERISQLREEIGGLEAQQSAKAKEFELMNRELRESEKLWAKNLVPLSKLIALQRDAARIEGERGQLIAAVARAKGKITETELQIIQIDQDLRTEVIKDLREIQAKNAEFIERRVAAEDQLKRIDIRAPQSGIVHQLAVHTVGGVINPGEPIMLIVPEADALVIEARIAPQDIDHVQPGQKAFIRFTAFNQRTTPEFEGEVLRVGADLTKEAQTNQAYFLTRITLPEAEIKRLGLLKLVPGMPAEVYIKTTERTAISYILKPLSDQIAKAFIER
jgi:membrane fusion protein, type I secretion system